MTEAWHMVEWAAGNARHPHGDVVPSEISERVGPNIETSDRTVLNPRTNRMLGISSSGKMVGMTVGSARISITSSVT